MKSSSLKKLQHFVFGSEQEDEQTRQAKIEAHLKGIEYYKARGDAGIEQLIGLLKVDSFVVGDRASEALAEKGAAAVPALRNYLYEQIAEVHARKRKNVIRGSIGIILLDTPTNKVLTNRNRVKWLV